MARSRGIGGTYPACEVMVMNQTTNSCEGNSSCPGGSPVTWPQVTTSNTWDDFIESKGYQQGFYHNLLQQQITSNDTPPANGQATITKKWTYQPDDQTLGGTVYYDVNKAIHSEVDESNGTAWQCQDTIYDEGNTSGVAPGTPVAGWPTTVTTYSNCADSHTAITTSTGYDAYGNTVATVDGVASANSNLYGSSGITPDNGCTLPTAPVIMGANWSKTNYTTCTTYDKDNGQAFEALPAIETNAFGQTTTYGYDYTQGALPVSLTDANSKQTTTAYIFDSGSATNDKRSVNVSEPGECGTLTAVQQTSMLYTILGQPTQVLVLDMLPQSGQSITQATTTASYDSLGQLTTLNDPDRGMHTYTYDPDGHVLSDVSGTRTLGDNYDLLGRLGCEQDAAPTINATGACTSGTHPYIQNSYDSSSINWGSTDSTVGRLAQSVATTDYPGSNTMTTTENFEYDQRGRPITARMTLTLPSAWGVTGLPVYQMATDYTDADQPLTTTTGTLATGTR